MKSNTDLPDQTRNLNPTLAARIAMIIYGRAYSEQNGGSMDFWDRLDPYNKKVCQAVVELIQDTEPSNLKPTATL